MKLTFLMVPALLCAACQGDVKTPFPAGLEPLEDNAVPTQQGGAYTETLRTSTTDNPIIMVYGRGYVLADPATVWQAAKTPEADVASCSTDEQMITPNNQAEYEFSFLVHYIVHNVLTVEWDDQWRFGTIVPDPPMQTFWIIKHQKTAGSDFITKSEGTITFTPTDDPNVTEVAFVEHLDAVGGGVDDVLKGTQHNYDAIVAVSHGNPIPACP